MCEVPRGSKHSDAEESHEKLPILSFHRGQIRAAKVRCLPYQKLLHELPSQWRYAVISANRVLIVLLTVLLSSCQGQKERNLEDYGDITTGPGGLSLSTPEEHPGGWGRRDCFLCHNVQLNIHRRPNNGLNADGMAELARQRGESYCLSCHGPNGIVVQ